MLKNIAILLASLASCFAGNNLASDEERYEGKEYKTAFYNPKDNPQLPNILLIGDSISIGYTQDVRKTLLNKADVFRIPSNGRNAGHGVLKIDQWLAMKPGKWDVIHFNWGLWDLCYRNPKSKAQGHRDKLHGTLTATPEQYRAELEKLVAKLKKTQATLIWCSTTPVPEHEAGRKLGDDLKYNKIAQEVMQKNGIAINDLHAHALLKQDAIQDKEGDVHFNKDGYHYLAKKVALEIETALSK